MHFWAQVAIVVCAVVLTATLVPAIMTLRRAAARADRVLGIVEEELRPLAAQAHALAADLRDLSHQAKGEVARVGAAMERVNDLAVGLGRAVSVLGGLTRAGQIVGVAAGLKKGIDVFVHRLRRQQGDNHE